jgi:hypothetical protein
VDAIKRKESRKRKKKREIKNGLNETGIKMEKLNIKF